MNQRIKRKRRGVGFGKGGNMAFVPDASLKPAAIASEPQNDEELEAMLATKSDAELLALYDSLPMDDNDELIIHF